MPTQKLAKAGALGIGAELWIVPNPEASPWARKIDWYLNFQMARATSHRQPLLSPELQHLLEENEVEFTSSTYSTETLMVATQLRVPAVQVILVPFKDDKTKWIKTCKELWEGLEHPRLRLFLPLEVKDSDIQKVWGDPRKKDDEPAELSFVPGDLPLDA